MRVILFDGVCNLCVFFVQFVIRRDPGRKFVFASLQSEAGRRLVREHQVPGDAVTTIILIEGDRFSWKSEAALRIFRGLSFPWPLLSPFVLVPRPIRDAVYDFVAARRYRWFGKRDECMIPTPDLKRRFLDV
ncbi:MAG TPA: thiol-disulfide oxidoreductase DCC family protein [Elusimicrobiota bacterium]|nr:thiol-disulfide oxidoreductase DCC family protein [Elusimicrobiota bacterium]